VIEHVPVRVIVLVITPAASAVVSIVAVAHPRHGRSATATAEHRRKAVARKVVS